MILKFATGHKEQSANQQL